MPAKTAIVRDIPIHYEEIGDGRPIVLLHGFSMEHRFMTHAYEPIFAAHAGTRPLMVPDGGASTLTCPAMARPLRRSG